MSMMRSKPAASSGLPAAAAASRRPRYQSRTVPKMSKVISCGSAVTGSRALFSDKFVALFAEEHVEGGERTVALRDVRLHVDLLGVGELGVRVDLLLEHSEAVADHHHLVEERVD